MAMNEGASEAVVARWTQRDEKVFIKLMVEQVKKGNRPTTTFSKKAWNEIIEEFCKKTGVKYKKQQFKNKFNKLRVQFREFKKLRDCPTGFGWNPTSKTVTAPNDVWEDYLLANPDARRFRNKGCPMFNELMIIYGDTKVADVRVLSQGATDTNDEDVDTPSEDSKSPVQDFAVDPEAEADFVENSNTRARSKTPTSPHRWEDKSLSAIAEACKAFTIIQQQRIESSSARAQDPFSISKCCEILAAMPDLSNEVYLKAGKMIQENRNWREFFICTPQSRRLFLLNSLE